jgi:hypothetical protein
LRPLSYTANDKPGSVFVSHLSKRHTRRRREAAPVPSYFVLLQLGFALRSPSLVCRWSLTPPFHPYSLRSGLFSVALSLGSPPLGFPEQLASRSPDFPRENPKALPRLTHSRSFEPAYRILPQISHLINSSASTWDTAGSRSRDRVFRDSFT